MKVKPVVLIILDGWGLAPPGHGNAVTLAKTPNISGFMASYPHGILQASGEAVGLPHGTDGNSETGHLNLGAGRIVYQDLPRINFSIADGSFFKIPSFLKAIEHCQKNSSNLHLMGLIGQGSVHSSLEHLFALLRLCKEQNFKDVYLHLFTDGRDSPPSSSLIYLEQVESCLKLLGIGKIATIMGRYYSMDRDNRWERTEKAYRALVDGLGEIGKDIRSAVLSSYEKGKTDEFIDPQIFIDENGKILPRINKNDSVIFFNYRIDRPRQLTKAFVISKLDELVGKKISFDPYAEKYFKKSYYEEEVISTFSRGPMIKNLFFVTMTEYETGLPTEVAFPPTIINLPLGRVLSERGLSQLRISESEKERFVTYYFDGQRDRFFPGEDKIVIPSPKVATYDLKPEMSCFELTEMFSKKAMAGLYDFVLVNFANPDMVGHTGVLSAGIKACEAVDECVGKIVRVVKNLGGVVIITADHGNVEEMINLQTGQVDTEHSSNPVPFSIIGKEFVGSNLVLPTGILGDVAPTILKLMDISLPSSMSGRSLI